jgi:hypothetical protein
MTTVFLIHAEIGDGAFEHAIHLTQAGAEAGLRTMLCRQMDIDPSEVADLSLDQLQDEYAEEMNDNNCGIKQSTLLP